MLGARIVAMTAAVALLALAGCSSEPRTPAERRAALRETLEAQGVHALQPPAAQDPDLVALGRALMFDKILSGNKDVSCATCHHPSLATADALPLSVGTGGHGLGAERVNGAGRVLAPRNATDLFLRGDPGWHTMFFDMRVRRTSPVAVFNPASHALPPGLDSLLAVQAMFPVTSRDEMRGEVGDRTVLGEPNELGLLAESDVIGIWDALMDRLRAIPAYVDLFAAAYPDVPTENLGFEHAANAIAAFTIDAFSPLDSPWDRFLAGDDDALSDDAVRGARLFYGEARCGSCHSGGLLTDQELHGLALPQLGPGKDETKPFDPGGLISTGREEDRYRFRTPPLRNVVLTAPYMHNGAYAEIEDAIRHHREPEKALRAYDAAANLPPELASTVMTDPAVVDAIAAQADPGLERIPALDDGQMADLLAFLDALTSPTATAERPGLIPETVPSGLPVED